MSYARAYQAYNQRNFEQCLKFLQEIKCNDSKKLDLMAQVHFQKKEYQSAYDIYYDLIKKGGDFTDERRENLQTLIVCAQLEQPGVLITKGNDKLPTIDEVIEQVEWINLKDEAVMNMIAKQESSKRKRKHKKRKVRLPKQYDPVAGPDPERWLPRRDRKSNRQKKRRLRPNTKGGKARQNK